MAGLQLRKVSKSFGTQAVLQEISLQAADGEFLILLGPSGCGKSTLLRLVAGLEEPDSGEILIGGREVNRLSPKDRDVAMVFQSYALYPHLTVAGNLAFGLKVRGASKAEIAKAVARAADILEIGDLLQRKPRQLSGGQRQRVAIGRAIVRRPALFLLDEPLSNLDARLRGEMRLELARLHQRLQATIIYVTHDQVEAMTLGQRVVVLAQGRIQQIGAPADIYRRPANLFVAGFIGSPAMNLLPGRISGDRFVCEAAGWDLAAPHWLAGRAEGELTLGIRPEDLALAEGPLTARLELVEQLGPESILHLKAKEMALRVKAGPNFGGRPGQGLTLGVDPERLHWFAQGQRIEP